MIYIGIPTYNLFDLLQQTLDSIGTKHPHRILVVDNASRDGHLIHKMGVEVIRNQINQGVSRAWNQIIDWAMSGNDCQAIFILNNDIVLHSDSLDNLIDSLLLEKWKGISGVSVGPSLANLTQYPTPSLDVEDRYIRGMHFSCFGLVPEVIEIIGNFDERFVNYVGDVDYHHRMIKANLRSGMDRCSPFAHFRSSTINRENVNPLTAQGNTIFKQKWGYMPEERTKFQNDDYFLLEERK